MSVSKKLTFALAGALAAAVVAPQSARAIGPNYQTLSDAAATGANNDVAWLQTGGVGTGGSGEVVGAQFVGTPAAGGTEYLAILTADHVAVGEAGGTANFGATGTALTLNLSNTFQEYQLAPNKPLEDIAVMQASFAVPGGGVGGPNLTAAQALVVNNAATIGTTWGALPATPNTPITQYGYGRSGQWYPNTGGANGPGINLPAGSNPATAAGYVGLTGTTGQNRRFQNNTVTTTAAPALVFGGDYFEPLVTYPIGTPTFTQGANPTSNGAGIGFSGDSGSPLFVGGANSNVTVTPNVGPNTGTATTITLTANNVESAVYTGGPRSNLTDANNDIFKLTTLASDMNNNPYNPGNAVLTGIGVPLLTTAQDMNLGYQQTGSYNWALNWANNPSLISVPEPTTIGLLVVGAGSLLFRPRRRA